MVVEKIISMKVLEVSLEGNYIFTDRDKTQDLLSRFFDENGDTTKSTVFSQMPFKKLRHRKKLDYENSR
jgi:hypothetical protein